MDRKLYNFPHADLTGKILEASFEVINELGAGYLESVYEKALYFVLTEKGLEVKSQVPINVHFRGQNVGQFFADLLVEEKIIVELKAVSHLTPEHKAQVINYLKSTGIEAGLLINFGNAKLEFYRLHP
jgi:GxxExxY protein